MPWVLHGGENAQPTEGGTDMGDKMQGKVDQATGKMKEAAGKAGDDESLEREGRPRGRSAGHGTRSGLSPGSSASSSPARLQLV